MDIGEIDEEFDIIERCLGVLAHAPLDRITEHDWLHLVDRYEKLTRLAFAAQRLPLARLAEAGPEAFGGERALHRRGCSCGLNPPVSSSDLAM